ncbi:MAG: hypothetical protein QNJ16_05395 [Rhodobacter sp.]|nr:hypothetical protein [Rhodobacter sp.]
MLSPTGAGRDLALYDVASDPGAMRSDRVTALIEIGFVSPDRGLAGWPEGLSMQVRQIALFQLAFSLGAWPAWFNSACSSCGAPVDLRVAVDEFEITPAPGPIPAEIEVEGPSGHVTFRVPTASDERKLESDPTLGLTELCATADLPRAEIDAWEQAFDAGLAKVLPGFEPELPFDCPECGATSGWWFDPIDWIGQHTRQCLAEVDTLARTYGWSEAAILALPEARRHQYLSIIGERR